VLAVAEKGFDRSSPITDTRRAARKEKSAMVFVFSFYFVGNRVNGERVSGAVGIEARCSSRRWMVVT
jgi:hypothetical protein